MRTVALLLLALLAAGRASAQLTATAPPARFSVSAFSGVRVPFTTGVMVGVDSAGGRLFQYEERRGGNPIVGLEGRVRLAGPVGLLAAGAFSRGGVREFFATDSSFFGQGPAFAVRSGSDVLFARVGLAARLEPRLAVDEAGTHPSTDFFAGAALVRELEDVHPALNLGFNGVLPVGRGVDFVLGLEDYLVFWDRSALQGRLTDRFRRLEGAAEAGLDQLTDVRLFFDTSNVLLLRAGISLRP